MNSVEGYKGFLSFLILSAVGISLVVGYNVATSPKSDTRTRAGQSDSTTPLEINIENVSSNSSEVSWFTKENTLGEIIYTNNNLMCEVSNLNECYRVVENQPTQNHVVQLNNLEPNSLYILKILIDGNLYPQGDPLSFKTLPLERNSETEAENENADQTINQTPDYNEMEPEYQGIDPNGQTQNNPINSGNIDQNNQDSFGILGKQTNIIDQLIIEEFTEAMEYNSKSYDFNKDGAVDVMDYPLFIEFIRNKED